MRRVMLTAVAAAAAFSLAAAGTNPTGSLAKTTYCRTAADTASKAMPILLALIGNVPSGDLDDYGFTSTPSSLALVTNEGTCQGIVSSYNGHIASVDSSRMVSSAFVFTDGTGFMFPVFLDGASSFHVVMTADSAFNIKRGFETLD